MTVYGPKIRQHLEAMIDPVRAQNAAAYALINMFPDPHSKGGFHAKFGEGANRHRFDRALAQLGLPEVPAIGRGNSVSGNLAKHLDNSETKRVGQQAYSVRKLSEDQIVATFLEVCCLTPTPEREQIVRDMAASFVSGSGPRPTEVDEILTVEEQRVPPMPTPPSQEPLFEAPLALVHLFERDSNTAYCGSRHLHQCDALGGLGYQLSYTEADRCYGCGAPICPTCQSKQPTP